MRIYSKKGVFCQPALWKSVSMGGRKEKKYLCNNFSSIPVETVCHLYHGKIAYLSFLKYECATKKNKPVY